MPYFIDLGGAPANEDCAQLGQTPDFDAVNEFEVSAYRLGIIARFGAPPPGCRLTALANRHDFGVYRTLVLHVENELDEAVRDYARKVDGGLGSWLEAGFVPPVSYVGPIATIPRHDTTELVIGALLTTRPNPDGTFAISPFEILHRNLSAAFPDAAETARDRLGTS